MPEEGKPILYLSAAVAGSVVLLTSVALYAGLAIGAHNEIRDKGKETGMDISLWPHPSWAAFCVSLSGLCLLGVAWRFQSEFQASLFHL